MSDSEDERVMNRKLSRRSLLKWSGALAAAGIVGIGLGIGGDLLIRPSTTKTTTSTATSTATGPTTTATRTVSAPPPTTLSYTPPLSPSVQTRVNDIVANLVSNHTGEQLQYTCCNQNGCFAGCLLTVRVKNGVITAIEGDHSINTNIAREDAYIPQSQIDQLMVQQRPCQRSHTWRYDLYAPDLILYPMKNVGGKGPTASFVRISWDEALSTIGTQMQQTVAQYGPYSIGGQVGFEGMPTVPSAFGFGHAEWGLQSFPAHAFSQLFTLGADWVVTETNNHNNDFFNSKLIVLWGWNPLSTFYESAYYLILAKERGIPIIAIEPTYTWSASVLASQWIPIRPSTDTAMMLAIANVLFKENLWDQDYVAKYVEPTGFQKWQDYVLGNAAGIDGAIDRTPEWAETICGVPAATITAFAELYASSKPVYLRYHWGPARTWGGENNSRIAIYLQAMTGNIGIPGSFSSGVGFNMIGNTMKLSRPWVDFGNPTPAYVAPTLANGNVEPRAVMIRDQLDSGQITVAEYNAQIGNPTGNPSPNIHMYVQMTYSGGIWAGNFHQSIYDANERIQALKTVDFVVNGFYHVSSELVNYSDIVLPICFDPFYDYGFFMPDDDTYGNYFLYFSKVVEPQGEMHTGFWYVTHLAAAMGFANQVNTKLQNIPDTEFDSTIASIHQQTYEAWAATYKNGVITGDDWSVTIPSWEDFVNDPIIRVPNTSPYVPFAAQIQNGPNFGTTSKKIEFYSDYIAQGPQNMAATTAPGADLPCYGNGYISPLAEYHMQDMGYLGTQVNNYPLYMITPHSYFRQHSAQDANPWMQDEVRHACWLSVPDANARGIVDGDQVHVYNDEGEMYLPAYVTSRIVPGMVVVRFGAWYQPSNVQTALMPDGVDMRGACNFLIPDNYFGQLVGIDFATSLVQVERASFTSPVFTETTTESSSSTSSSNSTTTTTTTTTETSSS